MSKMRKTRFVCISDTHNKGGAFKLPKGDVLIHAGDLTNQGSFSELQKAVNWLEGLDYEAKIVIAGNHDITLDSHFYQEFGGYFNNQAPQDVTACQQLLLTSNSITWLRHEPAVVKLRSLDGPQTSFKVFGSPLSPVKGMWAFGYEPDVAELNWNDIPLDADIVLTHTPAHTHCDETKSRAAAGCEALRQRLWRVRPRLAISGHVHEGRGVERVTWDLTSHNSRYKEGPVERWVDPGESNNKISLVDLTGKTGSILRNDGAVGSYKMAPQPKVSANEKNESLAVDREVSVLGQGGFPLTPRCDLEALEGRLSRQETCFINAAIMASSWPHTQSKSMFNKAIVIDVLLPVWED